MARTTTPWTPGYVLPNLDYGLAYRVMASLAYPKIKEIIENTLASALIYLPSSALDFKVPELRPYLDQFVRGSNGYTAEDRVKLMKLMWDAIGSEFGGRHELYERNYFGNHESIRFETLLVAEVTGATDALQGLRRAVHGRVQPRRLDGARPDQSDDVSAIMKKMTSPKGCMRPVRHVDRPATLRQTVGQFVTGVTVIAIEVDGEIRAMTANSFTSLSLDPPLVLFCLGKDTKAGQLIHGAPGFAVSILSHDQRDLSSYFAGAGRRRAAAVHVHGVGGRPRLDGCVAALGCRVHAIHEGGDHWIVVGQVIATYRDEMPASRWCSSAEDTSSSCSPIIRLR